MNCFWKLKHCFKKGNSVKFIFTDQSTKLSYFTNTKDKVPFFSKSSVVYEFSCPGCCTKYYSKTNIHPMNEHLNLCMLKIV